MNALIVYHSQYGNTQQVAQTVAQVLEGAGEARTLSAGRLQAADLQGVDLVVMGTPTHKMNLPEEVRPVFEGLPRHALRGVPVAAFDTSYEMSAFLARFTAAKKIDRALRRLGGKQLVAPETFHVHRDHKGPLFEGEVERARTWAGTILDKHRRLSGDGREKRR